MGRCGPGLLFLLWDHRPFRDAVVRACFSCFGTTGLSGMLWSELAFLALGSQVFSGHCGLGLLFLLWDHTPFRAAVVPACFSCFGTTRFSGVLWSQLAFLALGPHAFPGRCGPSLLFLLWDHRPFRSDVVPACFSCFGTTRFSGVLWSQLAFLALGPQAFPGRCGPSLLFLLWDHTLFQGTVVWDCFSCFGTTRFFRALWSDFSFLVLGPQAFPE